MAWSYDATNLFYFPSGTSDNTLNNLHDYINESSNTNNATASSVSINGYLLISLGTAGLRTGPTDGTETYTELVSTNGSITSNRNDRLSAFTAVNGATFLVNYTRSGSSPNYTYTITNPPPRGDLSAATVNALRTNFLSPWFLAQGEAGSWHHSGTTPSAGNDGIFNLLDGSITYIDGVSMYLGDAMKTFDGAVGAITNSNIAGSTYGQGNNNNRGLIFQKYDNGTVGFDGTALLGWEFLPNASAEFTGFERRGSTAGFFNAGRAATPAIIRNFNFTNNSLDFGSENVGEGTTSGSTYPQTQFYNSATGSNMSWQWNTGSGTTNKGDCRLYRELDFSVSDFDTGDSIEGSRIWIRDIDNRGRKTLPTTLSGLNATQQTGYAALVAQQDHQDKTYLITTGADGSADTWSFRGGAAATVPTTGVPFQVMIASWVAGATAGTLLTTDNATEALRLDKRTKGNVLGEDLIDIASYRYGYQPAVIQNVNLVGQGLLTTPVVHFEDNAITMSQTDAAAGASGVAITNGNIVASVAMSLNDLYDYQAYRRYEEDAFIETSSVSGFGNVVATSDETTIDFGAGDVTATAALTASEGKHTAISTTGDISLANFNLSGFTAVTANNFEHVPLIPNMMNVTGLGAGSPGPDVTGTISETASYNAAFALEPTAGVGLLFGSAIVVSAIDANGNNIETFLQALAADDTITSSHNGAEGVSYTIVSIDSGTATDGETWFSFTVDETLAFTTTGTLDFTFTQINVQVPGPDIPAPANALPTGGSYGATFLGGMWQLADGQTYSFVNGAFSNTNATLLGPTTGTATVNLAAGQTQADIVGSSTAIPNITFVENVVMYTVLPTIPDGFTAGGKFIVKRSTNSGTTWTEVNDRTITGGVLGGSDYEIPSTSTDMFRAYYKLDGELIGGSSTDWAITIETFTGASANRAVAPTLIPSVFTRDAPTTVTDSRTATFQNPTATSIELLWSGSLVELPADTYSALITAKNGATWIDWHADNDYTIERSEVGQSFGITWNNSVTGISGLPATQGVIFISGTASANPQYQVAQQLGQNTRDTTLGSGIPQVFSTTVGNATLGTVLAAITPAVDNSTLLNTVAGDVMDTETKVTEVLADTTNLRQNKLLGLKPQVVKP